MRFEWDRGELASPWAAAMGEHGDYWRGGPTHPPVLALCGALAPGGGPFRRSAFSAVLAALEDTSPAEPLAGLEVVDLGCGEGCLGRLVASRGAGYLGLDRSEALLAAGR